MAAKKFGTFAGVFVPSLLTILGVIMYLRLGWVVGNAGLYGAILIILIAHVISVTTGLSISSIATDKKVGAGGVYYVLSRSLGLPIGGAIGITLFVGTALSIALYLIGFAESFNAYFDLDTSINGLRITGSVALLALTVLAFISTDIALKAQFFILAAIALSLLSIFFGHSPQKPDEIVLFPNSDISLETIFAVFFPAVTGFTAGIAMSGDLKDSKKSIPVGTMAAIAVGLIVYLGLAFFMVYTIDADLLKNDYNILMKVALFAPAVVAGIWGATLSSALGGILGAPRILQAMSIDRITPKIFAKGKGASNEPINALILTVILAQAGILIGELDMIARVVSMFYLAAYGFINLSFFLESWASTDFNPSFKVKRWIGAVGFIAAFAVMFKLDMLAMIAALVIMGGIYIYLARKEISLGSGDIWQSVWANLIKRGLRKLDAKTEHVRNWKPNVLLFSGGSAARPHLIEFAKELAGNSGLITNFDLIENPNADKLFPKPKSAVEDELLKKYHIFGRKIEVKDIYEGIQIIATTFGFSGIEPNTVLMGWGKNTKNPEKFAQLTKNLIEQDYNVLFLDYDVKSKFGNYQTIDLWWHEENSNGMLMLSIARLLHNSEKWRNAKIRIIHINNTDVSKKVIETKLHNIVEDYRLNAEVKVINNAVEKLPVYELMITHSSKTDLILAGIPEIEGNEATFVEQTNKLFHNIGTTLLIKGSSKFKAVEGLQVNELKSEAVVQPVKIKSENLIPLSLPENQTLANLIVEFDAKYIKLVNEFLGEKINGISGAYKSFLDDIYKTVEANDDAKKALRSAKSISQNFKKKELPVLNNVLSDSIAQFMAELEFFIRQQKTVVKFNLSKKDLEPLAGESFYSKTIRKFKKFQYSLFKTAKHRVKWRKALWHYYQTKFINDFYDFEHQIGVETATLLLKIQQGFHQYIEQEDKNIAQSKLKELFEYIETTRNTIVVDLLNKHRAYLQQVKSSFLHFDFNEDLEEHLADIDTRKLKKVKELVQKYGEFWYQNQRIFHNQLEEDLQLNALGVLVRRKSKTIEQRINKEWFQAFEQQISVLKEKSLPEDSVAFYNIETVMEEVQNAFRQAILQVDESVTVIHPDDFNNFSEKQEMLSTVVLDIAQIADYIVENRFIVPLREELQKIINKLYVLQQMLHHNRQLVSYVLENKDISENERQEIFQKSDKEIQEISTDLELLKKQLKETLRDIMLNTIHDLDIRFIIEQSDQLSQYIKTIQRKKGIKKITHTLERKYSRYAKKVKNYYVYVNEKWRQSEYIQKVSAYANDESKLADFVQATELSASVKNKIPYYYQQLFGQKHLYNSYFSETRKIELDYFKDAIALSENNLSKGAIVVSGSPGVGKTYFIESAIKNLGISNFYKLNFPFGLSPTVNEFKKMVQSVTQLTGSVEEIFAQLPKNTVFVIENIEAWNNPSEKNNPVKHILHYINKYNHQLRFIVSINHKNIEYFNRWFDFKKYMAHFILLSPLNREQIQQIILDRHLTGGVQLFYNDVLVEQASKKDLRLLFTTIHKLSNGNISVAMQLWLSFIKQENDYLVIKPHYVPSFPEINDDANIALLYSFFSQLQMTEQQIKLSFGKTIENFESLERAEVIYRGNGKNYYINHHLLPWIENWLETKNIIQ